MNREPAKVTSQLLKVAGLGLRHQISGKRCTANYCVREVSTKLPNVKLEMLWDLLELLS